MGVTVQFLFIFIYDKYTQEKSIIYEMKTIRVKKLLKSVSSLPSVIHGFQNKPARVLDLLLDYMWLVTLCM